MGIEDRYNYYVNITSPVERMCCWKKENEISGGTVKCSKVIISRIKTSMEAIMFSKSASEVGIPGEGLKPC